MAMKTNKQTYTFIDLFAGLGGFHIALESLGCKCVFTSELKEDLRQLYKLNFPDVPLIEGDITKVDLTTIPHHDILCAGFPCQAFSISGSRKGFNDSRGILFFDVARIAKEKQPKILFLENVKNLEVHDNRKTFEIMKNTLDDIGYDVYSKVLDSAEYGSPQSRKRIYIVCFRKDLGIKNFEFPTPFQKHKYVKDILCQENADKYVINREDIIVSKDDTKMKCDTKPIRIGIVNKGGQGERIYSPKGKGITLSAYGGGVGAKTGLYKIDGKVRKLSPRECARMQGFPDDFKIADKDTVAYKQFGNSVVIDVLQQIVLQITNNEDVMKCL